MLRCTLFLLAFLTLCPRSDSADRPLPRGPATPPATIVLISADSVAAGDSPFAFAPLFRQALANHITYLLATRGLTASIKLFTADVGDTEALASLASIPGQNVLLLYYSTERQDETYVARDRHRRRYRSRAENCLYLQLRYRRYEQSTGGWTPHPGRTVSVQGDPSRFAVRTESGLVYCEPYDFVIQRALGDLAADLPGAVAVALRSSRSLPVRIYVCQSLTHDQTQIQSELRRMLAFASSRFESQFGVSLELAAIDTLPSRFDGRRGLQESRTELDVYLPENSDTLTVVINRLLHPDSYLAGDGREGIGLSRIGQRRIYMDLLPPVDPEDTLWASLANGLTLLHELGHTLGAIHVSDINSVMNHQGNWVNAADYDPFNRKLIAAALDGTLRFDDPAAYITFLTRILHATPYYLTDFPGFLHDYFIWGDNPRISERLRNAVADTAMLHAADAVALLDKGKPALAAQLLRAAIRATPLQASLYYYLSLAVDRRSAAALRAIARQRGWLLATEP